MELDIQYLLWLQDLRAATGGIFNEFFNGLSKVAVDIMPLLPYLIFWAVSRKWGYRFMLTRWLGEVVNGILKLTVCAYRPWVRSDAIEPAGDAKVAATGYSFPSGHTMCATTMYGTVAASQHKKKRWLVVLSVILIALTGFSRNFLGVHTPQDVLVGLAESILLVLFAGFLMRWMDGDDKKINIMTIAGVVFIAATLLYINLKAYPMDYIIAEDGSQILRVDPIKMQKDTFHGCGGLLGLLVGSLIERKYVHYEIPKGSAVLPLMAGVGLGLVFAWEQYFAAVTVIAAFGANWGNLVSGFLLTVFAVAVWPVVIKRFCSQEA